MLDNVAGYRHIVAMRPRIGTTPQQIVRALNESRGDVKAAARLLDISERTLYRRIAEHGIRPIRFGAVEEAA